MFPYRIVTIDGGFALHLLIILSLQIKFHCWVFPCGGGVSGPWGHGS